MLNSKEDFKIKNFAQMLEIHKQIESNPANVKNLVLWVQHYYHDNLKLFSDAEFMELSKIDYLEHQATCNVLLDRIKGGRSVNPHLITSLLRNDKPSKELFRVGVHDIMKVDVEDVHVSCRQWLLDRKLLSAIKGSKLLSDKDILECLTYINHEIFSYAKIAYEQNYSQFETMVKMHPALLVSPLYVGQKIIPRYMELVEEYGPQEFIAYSHILPPKDCLAFIEKNFDKMVSAIGEEDFSNSSQEFKDSLCDICVFNFLKTGDNIELYLKKFGHEFIKRVEGAYDIKGFLATNQELDLSYMLDDTTYNYVSRCAQMNYLQFFICMAPDAQGLEEMIAHYQDLFFAPVIEKINDIEYSKAWIDFLFEHHEYNVVFNYVVPYIGSLPEKEKLITTQVLMKKYILDNDETLLQAINHISYDIFEKGYDVMQKSYSDNPKIKELKAIGISLFLEKSLESKEVKSKNLKI